MPILLTDIETNLLSVFQNLTDDKVVAGNKWADSVRNYMLPLSPPSLLHSQARDVFFSSFLQINFINGIVQLPKCFEDYNDIVASGMSPSFTGTPPPKGTLNLLPVYVLGLSGGSYEACAKLMASILYPWYLTGKATNNATGVTIPWI